ncbi:MAG: polyphosphate kinase 1 [Leptospirales bacterium]|nr:polyphosphate kinase 1 [Leptospirales bacterium]
MAQSTNPKHAAEKAARRQSRRAEPGAPLLSRSNHELFINREISWLQFNNRVLEEAGRKDNPLLERLKFLAIFEANLFEFFMIRAAGLKQVLASAIPEIQDDGRTPLATLQEISRISHQAEQTMSRQLREVLAGLREHGLDLIDSYRDLVPHERSYAADYFHREVFRILTPLAIDPAHPFPHIVNGRLNLAVTLRRKNAPVKNQDSYAIVEVPNVLPRFLELPARSKAHGPRRYIALEEVIKMHAAELFSGTAVRSFHGFTIIRNNDLSIDEVASDNLLSTIEEELKNRRWGEAVRLTCREGMPENIREFLRERLDLEPYEIYERPGPLNLQDLWQLYNTPAENPELRDRPFIAHNPIADYKPEKLFAQIRKKDLLLHHPFQSFQPVVDLVNYAARDAKTLAIKQTLYRTGTDSPIVRALIQAAENGKQVTALVELKARFDEERNINWAREMEKHGVHVVYGLVGLKIHGKMLQIVRREADGVKAYCHLSTGNYNPITARMYTDISLFTCDSAINDDVTDLFHSLTGYSTPARFRKLAAAPINLRETLLRLVQREIANAEAGKPARIRLKMNSLVDSDMILALYRASRAGVPIELVVRGICCLRPGIKGVSDNIEVYSVVGRFLEHSRIFYFENGGQPRVFLSSADWMPRNLNRRVEILFPVEDADHVASLRGVLDAIARDNHNRRRILTDGSYERLRPGANEARFSSQRHFRETAIKEFAELERAIANRRRTVFQPLTNPDRGALAPAADHEETEKESRPQSPLESLAEHTSGVSDG